MELKILTQQLKQHLNKLKERYNHIEPPKNRRDKDFFELVKRETTPVYSLLEEWEEMALEKVKEREINVHPQQVTRTRENMELVLMHSYYIDARRKRYMELSQSVLYIFDQIISELSVLYKRLKSLYIV